MIRPYPYRMQPTPISKLDAARRQLDTAIEMFFENCDSLSIHTLAHASFRLLYDIYPSARDDGFATQLADVIQPFGWNRFSRTANFLKHADRDPNEVLYHHDAEHVEATIMLACLLYRRIAGDFTPMMRGFDCWTEALYPDALNIAPDPDPEIAAQEAEWVSAIRAAPLAERLAMSKSLTEALTKLWESREADCRQNTIR